MDSPTPSLRAALVASRKRKFWVAVAALAIIAGVIVPLVGLYEMSTAASDVGELAGIRTAFDNANQGIADFGVAGRNYELSGANAAQRDATLLAAIDKTNATLTQEIGALNTAPNSRSSLVGDTQKASDALAAYQVAVDARTKALQTDTDTPALAQTQTNARSTASIPLASLSDALAHQSDDAIATLNHSRDVSLAASGTSAFVLLALLALLAASQVRSGRRVVAAAGTRVAAADTRVAAAEKVADQRAQMVSLASHELRNPLAAMSGAVQLIEEHAEDNNDAGLLELARAGIAAARQAEDLVSQLLDLSRIDAGMLKLDITSVVPAPIVQDAITMTRARHGNRDIIVLGDIGDGATVRADPVRLSIVIRNLIDNGVKYSRAPGVVTITLAQQDAGHVCVDVTDEGPGVPADRTEAIFERFNRLEQTRDVPGVGIGLHLSRELARRMGGELQAFHESKGGHFRLTLPSDAPRPVPVPSPSRVTVTA